MKILVSAMFGLVSAVLLAVLAGLVVGGGAHGAPISLWTFLLGWLGSILLFAATPTLKRSTGRACLTIALESFGAITIALGVFGFFLGLVFVVAVYFLLRGERGGSAVPSAAPAAS